MRIIVVSIEQKITNYWDFIDTTNMTPVYSVYDRCEAEA